LAGIVIGTDGTIGGTIKRVDIFHYIISVANVLLAWGIKERAV
jgi:hypothetical protein